MSRMGRLKRDVVKSGVDLWQSSNPGGSQWVTMCYVRRQGSNARVNGFDRSTMINATFPFFSYSILCDSKGCAYKAIFHEFISLNNGTRLLYRLGYMGGPNDYIEYHLLYPST